MRMWMLDPKCLCNKHLIGEHGELHKHRHNFVKQHNIDGRIKPVVQIEPASMGTRHEELAKEMLSRGINHRSPYTMPDISYLPDNKRFVKVDLAVSMIDLTKRCSVCTSKIQNNS